MQEVKEYDLYEGDDLDRRFIVTLDQLREIYQDGYSEGLNEKGVYECFFLGIEIEE